METKAAASPAKPDLITGPTPAARVEKAQTPAPVSPVEAAADLRLIIERNEATDSYTYTTVNRITGEIVQRIPRDDVLKMSDQNNYAIGQVISAQA